MTDQSTGDDARDKQETPPPGPASSPQGGTSPSGAPAAAGPKRKPSGKAPLELPGLAWLGVAWAFLADARR